MAPCSLPSGQLEPHDPSHLVSAVNSKVHALLGPDPVQPNDAQHPERPCTLPLFRKNTFSGLLNNPPSSLVCHLRAVWYLISRPVFSLPFPFRPCRRRSSKQVLPTLVPFPLVL